MDRTALARLMSSICRFLDPADAATAEAGADVEILDSRRPRQLAANSKPTWRSGSCSRWSRFALDPGSELACCRWVAERAAAATGPGAVAVSRRLARCDLRTGGPLIPAPITQLLFSPLLL